MARRHAAAVAFAVLLLLTAPLTILAEVSGLSGPKGRYAGKSARRCGAFIGSEAVEESKQQHDNGVEQPLMTISDDSSYCGSSSPFGDDVLVCHKHLLREHHTKLRRTKVDGTTVKLQQQVMFAAAGGSADEIPNISSSEFYVVSAVASSKSSASDSSSSPASVSSSSDSVPPELTTVSFIAELIMPAASPNGRRHIMHQQAFKTAVPTDEEVAAINSWLGDFAKDNSDVVDGRDSITATSLRRGSTAGGVIFFTVFILTSDPATVEARIVALPPDFSSSRLVSDAAAVFLSEPQLGRDGEDVIRFGAEEDLAAQLSTPPPSGCSNPFDPVVATPRLILHPLQSLPPLRQPRRPLMRQALHPMRQLRTTTPSQTTTPLETTTPSDETTTASPPPSAG